jgi:CO/xanthine dehydrogenase Mo-binding subunit
MATTTDTGKSVKTQGPVGQSVVRADGREKVRGEPIYYGDLHLPNMLYGRALRSRYPHARILGIDASRARALPGVVAVATAAEIPGNRNFGRTDQPILSSDKVRFLGDVVALVAAETLEIATGALALIQVQYEELPAVFGPREGMAPGAPLVHEGRPDNVLRHFKLRKGAADDAFAACDVIVERTYQTPQVEHAYLEIEGAVANCNPDGGLTIWSPGQFSTIIREFTAAMLVLPSERIRVILTNAGGGFGGKEDMGYECGCRVALLSWLAKRPVKLVIDREESISTSSKRHAALIEYKSGATRDGRLQAVAVRVYLNKGAYASVGAPIPPAGGLTDKTGYHAGGPYQIPHARVDVYNVYTNTPVGAAMRGFGVPQLAFAHEAQMDELAAALAMDPLEIRLLNGLEAGSRTTSNQLLESSVGLKETMRQATERAGWRRFRRAKTVAPAGRYRRGMGMASFWFATALGTWPEYANCTMEVNGHGMIVVRAAVAELGQGVRTAHAQIAAEALGISLDHVVVARQLDTAVDPDSQLTVASRGTLMGGNAIVRAAAEARQAMIEMAADMMDVSPAQLEFVADRFRVKATGSTATVHDVLLYCFRCGRRLLGKGWWCIPRTSADPETAQGNPFHVFAYGTQVAEVEVDTVTGQVEVRRIVSAQDVGRAINPALVAAQMHGGVSMGLGYALTEEIVLEAGRVKNASLSTYLLPTAMDTPQVETILVEDPYPNGPFGAKGVAEPGTVPTAAAVANAVADAIGVRVHQLPLTAERVWRTLREGQPGAGSLPVQACGTD